MSLSIASHLDGVAHIMVVIDLVVHGCTVRGKIAPSLLPGLGTPSTRVVGAIAEGAIAISSLR